MDKTIVDLAMSFYAGEPCRICGEIITKDDLSELVYAGYTWTIRRDQRMVNVGTKIYLKKTGNIH